MKTPLLLALFVPCALYLGITAFWLGGENNRITGDEPHFLMITESLVRDGDLWVANNYTQDTLVTRAMGRRWLAADEEEQIAGYSLHSPALPLLLVPGYMLAGIAGAKLGLALLIGLGLPWLLYASTLPILGSVRRSVLLALTFAISLPFLAGANQIYADMVGGLFILHAASRLVEGFRRNRLRQADLWWLAFDAAALPWFHLRFAAPSLVLIAFTVWGALAFRSETSKARNLLPLTPVLASYALLAVYHLIAFQNPLGPLGPDNLVLSLTPPAMVFLGLHLDSFQGVFFQQPLLFAALLGIAPMLRDNTRGALLLAVLYLAILVPASMHWDWYGGTCFAGRYSWGAVSLWIFPLAYTFKLFLERRGGAALVMGLCAASIALQALLASEWLLHNVVLYNAGLGLPRWAQSDLYTDVFRLDLTQHGWLPSFRDFGGYFKSPTNFGWVWVCVLMAAAGLWLSRSRPVRWLWFGLAAMGAAASVCGLLILTPLSTEPLRWTGAHIAGDTGSPEADDRVAQPGNPGIIVRSPRLPAYANILYRITLDYQTGNTSPGRYFLALDGGAHIATTEHLPSTFERPASLTVDTPFQSSARNGFTTVEFWVYYNGSGALRVAHLTIQPIGTNQ